MNAVEDAGRRSKVFISYAREDQQFVRRLAHALAECGRDVWVDWEGIPATAKWQDEIRRGIEGADAMIFVLSRRSLASTVCLEELRHAVTFNKRLAPIVIEHLGDQPVPEGLAAVNWLFFPPGADFDAGLAALRDALDTDLEWLRAHTKLLVQALEWAEKGADKSLLLRGRELEEAEQWLATQRQDPQPTPSQGQFVLASRRSATRRQRSVVGAATGAVVVTAALALAALVQRDEAVSQAKTALSRQLANDAHSALETDPERALLLAMEAYDRKPTSEARRVLREALVFARVRATFRGEAGPVKSAAFAPDGKSVVSGAADGTIRVWDVAGRKPRVLRGHEEAVTSVAFSPDGRSVVSASEDSTLRLWDVTSGESRILEDQTDEVFSVAFSSDGRYVLTGQDGGVGVHDLVRGGERRELPDAEYNAWAAGFQGRDANSAAFSPDGRFVAAAGEDGNVRLWDFHGGGPPTLLAGHMDEVRSVSFSPDGRFVVSGGEDSSVRLWDLEGGGTSEVLGDHDGPVTAVAYSPDGRNVVSASWAGVVKVWAVDGNGSTELNGHVGEVTSVSFSPDGAIVLTAGDDGTVRLWDWARSWPHYLPGPANDARFSADGRRVLAAGKDGIIREWDLAAGGDPRPLGAHDGEVYAVGYSPDGELVVSAGENGDFDRTVRVWDLKTRKLLAEKPEFLDRVYAAAFSPDGQQVATSNGHWLNMWSWVTKDPPQEWGGHEGVIFDVAFSPDGRRVASAGEDGTVRIWDVDGDGNATVLEGHGGAVRSVAFSSDGRRVVSAGEDQTVRIWDVAGKDRPRVLRSHVEGAIDAAFTPGDKFVVSVGSDRMLLWDLDDDQPRGVFFGPAAGSVSISPDGRRVVAAQGDEAVVVNCEICRPIRELRKQAESRVTRELTAEERATFLHEK